jgi:adenylate cyclase
MSDLTDVTRRLVAVFAAGVEGYSRLMGADEVGTLKGLTERRAILDRLIGEHRGRIANTAGDSVLAEFGSAVASVQCAVEAQTVLAEANSSLAPDRRISFRIGTLSDFLFKTCVACFFLSCCLTNHFISSSNFRASPNNA